jgi:putative ABC transport system permease protein
MRAVLTQIRAGVVRRRAQTAIVLIICILASSVATMAVTLLVRSTSPWDNASERYQGAHLIFHFDASRVSAEQLLTTRSLPGVTAAGPPHPTVIVSFEDRNQKGNVQLIGRDTPGGAVDRIPIAAGRWPQRPGEIVVTRTEDSTIPIQPHVGDTIHALTNHGVIDFKVVGEAIDLGGHGAALDFSNGVAAAWVLPADVMALADGQEVRLGYEMAYRFRNATTEQDLAADRSEIEAALPAGIETQPVIDWIRLRGGSIWLITLLSSIFVSFTVFALVAVAVIVASVVAGSVLSSYRDIGIIKALGFTPVQVLGVYVGQMAVPGLVGGLLGVPLGALASRPFLDYAASSLQLPAPSIFDPVVALIVPSALALLVVLAAVLPALRAAATDSERAIVLGSAPPATRRSRLAAGLARLGAPRAFSIGAGDAFARPVRATLTLTALTIGIATATFAIGFQETLVTLLTKEPASYGYGQDVVVNRYPGIDDSAAMQLLEQQAETQLVVGVRMTPVKVSRIKDVVALYAIKGDASALGYTAVQGRWFERANEAVIGGAAAKEAHLGIGDSLLITLPGGATVAVRVVGVMNDFNTGVGSVRVSWDTITTAIPGVAPNQYLVKLRRGSDLTGFAHRITAAAPDFLQAQVTSFSDISLYSNGITWLITALALVLLAIAAAGIFNAARLTTLERVRDIAVLKAIGMTARQIALMLVASTLVFAVVAAVIGLPLGVWLEGVILTNIGDFFGVAIDTLAGVSPIPLALALVVAFVLALIGGALPARWAAATSVAAVLRSE